MKSAPESSTATRTPLPSRPMFCSADAPMYGTVSLRSSLYSAIGMTCATPAMRARAAAWPAAISTTSALLALTRPASRLPPSACACDITSACFCRSCAA